jgi:phosphoglycolate phosphatase-like HAD superfamily hydrolase
MQRTRRRRDVVKLILFDIDGTLLWTEGAGRRAMEGALTRHFGTPGPGAYRYDGKTDAQIVRETMREAGFTDDLIDRQLPVVLAEYLERLDGELAVSPTRLRRFEGVLELLDALEQRTDRVLGLLTGNIAHGATRKLRAVGIAPERFRVGAFGSDHEHRHELPAIALDRAEQTLGTRIPGSRAIIVGDTPNDIQCGRSVGARAIGVATGHYTVAQLTEHGPAACFADLRDTAAVLRAIDDA